MKPLIMALIAVLLVCSCSSIPPKEEAFTVNLKSPRYSAGSAEAYLKKSFSSSLDKIDIDVFYYPVEGAVCLHFKFRFVDCLQFWDWDGMDAFASAFTRYKEEYEQRQLIVKKNRNTRGMYGEVPAYFAWKKTAVSAQAQGSAKIKLGYQFSGKSAFFTTTQMEVYYEDQIGYSRNQTSEVVPLYFTRAQAESLIMLFNQEYLRGLGRPEPGGGAAALDEY